MSRRQSNQTLDQILDEVYAEIPSHEVTEDDVDGMYRQYEEMMRREELSSLDLDFCQE